MTSADSKGGSMIIAAGISADTVPGCMPVMNTCAGNPGGCTLHFPLFQSEKITPGTELKTTA